MASKTPRRVYVDFDDVLCETARGLLELLREEFGKHVAYEDIRHFDLGRSFGLTAGELKGFLAAAHAPQCVGNLAPVEGAREALRAWKKAGVEVFVVTGRPPETEEDSRAWLERHSIPYDRLFFVDKYGRLPPSSSLVALESLADMGFSLAIDDAPAMLEFLVNSLPVPVIIFDRPWNAAFSGDDGRALKPVLRCASWAAIGKSAERLLAG